MSRRLLGALPLLFVALALGHAAAWAPALLLLAAITLVSALGPRWQVDRGRQWLSSVVGAGAGYLLASFSYEPEPGRLSDGWTKLCCATLLAALARSLLVAPRGGARLTLALAFAALVFAGKTSNPAYAVYVVPFLVSGLWLAGESPHPLSASALRPRRVGMGTLVLALAALLGLGVISGHLALSAWAKSRYRITSSAVRSSVGFSERMDLGALDGLLDSDQRVLRVRGAPVDYLRGIVFDSYEAGSWLASDAAIESTKARFESRGQPLPTQIEAISGRLERAFLPLAAARLETTPSDVLIDDLGAVRVEPKRHLASARFDGAPRDGARITGPRASDLHLSRRIKRRIEALAAEWTRGASTDADKLRAIETRLMSEFSYARAFQRAPNLDPVLAFLFEDRRGHCEYFASALALLGRAAGVPTRVVMGYRVTERSPFGYFVVRERNAHAWVEAWLPGSGWVTRDATPAEAQPQNAEREASYFESSLDALRVGYAELTDWLEQRTLEQTGLAWLFGCAVLAVIIARGVRRRTRERALADDEALLPFMQPLLDGLDRTGVERSPDEPLERLAARLPDAEPARLLLRYSALRYGGIGDGPALARDVNAAVARLRRRV